MILGALLTAKAKVQDTRRFLSLSERKSDSVKFILESKPQDEPSTPSEEWAQEVASFTTGRTYDYVCAIILLYGLFERFIEDLAEEYLDALIFRLKNFSALPEKIRQSHFKLITAQLQRTQDSRYNGKSDATRLAKSLSACLQDQTPIDFICEPFLYHTSNFRMRVVDEFLGQIGIANASQRAARTQAFEDYNNAQENKKVIPAERPEAVWELINDLVERRNQVAHGDMSAALAPSELYPYCDFIEAYCQSLARVTRDSLVKTLAPSVGVAHDLPIKVFNHNIVCIHSKGVELSPGSILACKTPGDDWYSLVIEEVQIDGKTISSSPPGKDLPVGLRTDDRCKIGHTIFSIK